ncbi:polyhydroxyalkanoate depolymerase [Noviherbaspirillum denitrificans]|uniref:Esterase n=1 Tax=Noviherbaspirillum denitrificans TaxID=1968433 RepID=A0A254T5Q8_9BURK|nr:polyhydroxyalkanoate depolymerase [Noviherbaspirillum denitrificans]OWW18039.1 esterase [Noviherbaspirillum denitrificans]
MTNPASPFAYTPFSQRMAAGFELLYRLGKEYEKPHFEIVSTLVDGVTVPVSKTVALDKPFCHLQHFRKDPAAMQVPAQPKVLLLAPLSGHHATLLRDTVITLLPEHDVYITDWIDAKMVPLSKGEFHLHDYVYYLQEFMRFLGPDLHVIAVCQPSVPLLAAVALMSTAKDPLVPRTMTMMGGPIDTRKSPTMVDQLATERDLDWFENTVIYRVPPNYPGAGRRVYPGFLQHFSFVAMNAARHAKSYQEFYEHLARNGSDKVVEHHRRFYDEYNAVLDIPAEFYLETVKTVFQESSLATGTWEVEGKPVRPEDIKHVGLLTIEGEWDDITGRGQTRAAHNLCTGIPRSKKEHYTAPAVGHYGIFSGRRWHERVCPKIADFIRANAGQRKA